MYKSTVIPKKTGALLQFQALNLTLKSASRETDLSGNNRSYTPSVRLIMLQAGFNILFVR